MAFRILASFRIFSVWNNLDKCGRIVRVSEITVSIRGSGEAPDNTCFQSRGQIGDHITVKGSADVDATDCTTFNVRNCGFGSQPLSIMQHLLHWVSSRSIIVAHRFFKLD
jgi:hypothetical protein